MPSAVQSFLLSSKERADKALYSPKVFGVVVRRKANFQGDDAWHTLFECPVFQLYWEDAMTTLQVMGKQPLTPYSLVPIMLRSTEGWDQVATFVTLTMRRKMEIVQERQRRPIAAIMQHPMPDFAIPLTGLPLAIQYSWLDKTTSYSTHYAAGIKIWYQKNVELIYHKR